MRTGDYVCTSYRNRSERKTREKKEKPNRTRVRTYMYNIERKKTLFCIRAECDCAIDSYAGERIDRYYIYTRHFVTYMEIYTDG